MSDIIVCASCGAPNVLTAEQLDAIEAAACSPSEGGIDVDAAYDRRERTADALAVHVGSMRAHDIVDDIIDAYEGRAERQDAARLPVSGESEGHVLPGAWCRTHATYEDHTISGESYDEWVQLQVNPSLRDAYMAGSRSVSGESKGLREAAQAALDEWDAATRDWLEWFARGGKGFHTFPREARNRLAAALGGRRFGTMSAAGIGQGANDARVPRSRPSVTSPLNPLHDAAVAGRTELDVDEPTDAQIVAAWNEASKADWYATDSWTEHVARGRAFLAALRATPPAGAASE